MGQKWETAPRKAAKDTKKWLLGTLIAWILTSIMGVIVGVVASALIIPPTDTALIYRILYGAGGAVVGVIVALILLIGVVYVIYLIITPRRQRNELRRELDNTKAKKPTSVKESITQGFAELAQVLKDVRQNPHFASQNPGQPYVIKNIDEVIGITETKAGKPAFIVPIGAENLGTVCVGSKTNLQWIIYLE